MILILKAPQCTIFCFNSHFKFISSNFSSMTSLYMGSFTNWLLTQHAFSPILLADGATSPGEEHEAQVSKWFFQSKGQNC